MKRKKFSQKKMTNMVKNCLATHTEGERNRLPMLLSFGMDRLLVLAAGNKTPTTTKYFSDALSFVSRLCLKRNASDKKVPCQDKDIDVVDGDPEKEENIKNTKYYSSHTQMPGLKGIYILLLMTNHM